MRQFVAGCVMSSNFHALMLIKHSTSDTHQGNTDETAEQNLPVLKKKTRFKVSKFICFIASVEAKVGKDSKGQELNLTLSCQRKLTLKMKSHD